MIYPNGSITLRKLQEIVNDHDNWKVVAENIYTKEQFSIKDENDLREYIFYNGYRFGYDFIGDWEEYRKQKDGILFDWKRVKSKLKTKENAVILSKTVPTTKLYTNCGVYHDELKVWDRTFKCGKFMFFLIIPPFIFFTDLS